MHPPLQSNSVALQAQAERNAELGIPSLPLGSITASSGFSRKGSFGTTAMKQSTGFAFTSALGMLTQALNHWSPRSSGSACSTRSGQNQRGQIEELNVFFDADYDATDLGEFRQGLFDSIRTKGVPDHVLNQLSIDLQRGSVIARISGPVSAMAHLREIDLQSLIVSGHQAFLSRDQVREAEGERRVQEAYAEAEQRGSAQEAEDARRTAEAQEALRRTNARAAETEKAQRAAEARTTEARAAEARAARALSCQPDVTTDESIAKALLAELKRGGDRRRPSDHELDVMVARILKLRGMNEEQGVEVKCMLVDIANTLFGSSSSISA